MSAPPRRAPGGQHPLHHFRDRHGCGLLASDQVEMVAGDPPASPVLLGNPGSWLVISLQIYKFLAALTANRPDCFSCDPCTLGQKIRTFSDEGARTHVVFGYDECRFILTHDGFAQPRITDAIDAVMGMPQECLINERFLRPNPINLDGTTHRRTRRRFIQSFNKAFNAVKPDLPEHARRSMAELAAVSPPDDHSRAIPDFIDSVLTRVLSAYGVENPSKSHWQSGSSSIFDYFHSRTRLKRKESEISGFVSSISRESGAVCDSDLPIILSYLLQGRDPLIGSLSAYLNALANQGASERVQCIRETTARDLIWRTSPVNYIGRTAEANASVGDTEILRGDKLLLMLPWARAASCTGPSPSLAFGGGAHTCAGQAISLEITAHWLSALRSWHDRINWDALAPLKPVPGVFRQYKIQ